MFMLVLMLASMCVDAVVGCFEIHHENDVRYEYGSAGDYPFRFSYATLDYQRPIAESSNVCIMQGAQPTFCSGKRVG